MSKPITERILGANRFYTDQYLIDTLNLTKSIVITHSTEATKYNEYLETIYSVYGISKVDKDTWRYYKHLKAEYYVFDIPMILTSIDNGERITLSRESMSIHKLTRHELLNFGNFYNELVAQYREQELLIKTIITDPIAFPKEAYDLPNFTITHYNSALVEENEQDLIPQLQDRINRFKESKLLPYYSVSDGLFLASQYHILYTFIFKSILAIRLKNAKTNKAHSYHILNYLSSHHGLDRYFYLLTKSQSLFLYRNLLYLNNHSGTEEVFRTLIDELFTDRNISVVNYQFTQASTLTEDNFMDYSFKQRLLNNKPLVYSDKEYSLQELLHKERNLAKNNIREIELNTKQINEMFQNSLYSLFFTKDIESIITDNSDNVRHKFLPTLIDYTAYMLKTNRVNFLVQFFNPVNNDEIVLPLTDAFKLFIILLYQANNIQLTQAFPIYTITRVLNPDRLTKEELLSHFFNRNRFRDRKLQEILQAIPSYRNVITSSDYEVFIRNIYTTNIGLWLYTESLGDSLDNSQLCNAIENLHMTDTLEINDESPEHFLRRTGLMDLPSYSRETVDDMMFFILNRIFNSRLDFLDRYEYIQKALNEVISRFKSYTVSLLDNYSKQDTLLTGIDAPRLTVSGNVNRRLFFHDLFDVDVEIGYGTHQKVLNLEVGTDYEATQKTTESLPIAIDMDTDLIAHKYIELQVDLKESNLIELDNNEWLVSTDQSQLLFLSLNT